MNNFVVFFSYIVKLQAVFLRAIFAPIKALHLVIDLAHEFYIQVSALTGWQSFRKYQLGRFFGRRQFDFLSGNNFTVISIKSRTFYINFQRIQHNGIRRTFYLEFRRKKKNQISNQKIRSNRYKDKREISLESLAKNNR